MLWPEVSPASRSSVVRVISVDLPDSFAPCSCIRPSAYQTSAASYSHRFTTPARCGCHRSDRVGSGSWPVIAATRQHVLDDIEHLRGGVFECLRQRAEIVLVNPLGDRRGLGLVERYHPEFVGH